MISPYLIIQSGDVTSIRRGFAYEITEAFEPRSQYLHEAFTVQWKSS